MFLIETNKALTLYKGDKITIETVIDPLTKQEIFLVTNERSNTALMTDNITISGAKLVSRE
jgi:hypothetical protein